MERIIECAIVFLTSLSINAQTLKGTVKSIDGEPIERALVTIVKGNTTPKITALTDSAGIFSFAECPQKFAIEVVAFGFKTYKKENEMQTSKPLAIVLENLSVGEVVVKGNGRPSMEREGNKLVIDNIENSIYAKGSNMFTFIRFIPAIEMPVFGGDIKLNEAIGKPVKILVNGKPLNIPAEAYLKKLLATDVDKLEVVASPMGEYRVKGDYGVINIILKKQHNKETKYSLYVRDGQSERNRLSGSFGLTSQINDKLSLSAGFYQAHFLSFIEKIANYRYYPLNKATDEYTNEKSRMTFGNAYLNMDYALDSLSTLGTRLAVNWASEKERLEVKSNYRKLDGTGIDSTYTTHTVTHTPTLFAGVSANVNYSRRMDSRGSMFFADLDYRYALPKNYREMDYERMEGNVSTPYSFAQKSKSYYEGYGLWLRYNANATKKVSFYNNVNLLFGRSHFDDTYTGLYNMHNVSNIKDVNLNASSSYVHRWTDKFSTTLQLTLMGVWQNKEVEGGRKTFNRYWFLLPSLQLNYVPSKKHYLSAKLYKNVYIASYFEMDPVKNYSTPTTYKVGNPNLDAAKSYRVILNYTLMNNYGLSVYWDDMKNVGTDYTVTDGKGNTVITHLNGVKMKKIDISLYGGVGLFNDYLYLRPSLWWGFSRYEDSMNGTLNINYGHSLSLQPSVNVTLSKRHKVFFYTRFTYSPKSLESNSIWPEFIQIDASLTKNFANSSLSIGMGTSFKKYSHFYKETPNFGFDTRTRNTMGFSITYSLTFGNKKVRDVQNRSNYNLKSRFGN